MSDRESYRAPAQHGQILQVPPLADYGELLLNNGKILQDSAISIRGLSLRDLRLKAADDCLQAAKHYHAELGEPIPAIAPGNRLLVTGHQPELYHPGVWIKNFALNRLAKQHELTPLNLIVDTDLIKSSAIQVPHVVDGEFHTVPASYGEIAKGTTYEGNSIPADGLFATFPERVKHLLASRGTILLDSIWPDKPRSLTDTLTAPRRATERGWGCHNLELPISRLAETESFKLFVQAVLDDLTNFAAIYNQAVRDYRTTYKLHSQNHPVPELMQRDGRWESPFWIADPGHSRRESYFHDPARNALDLPLRPKALMTTLYARVFLGVGFIHGIGGGKYDEVTDNIIRRWLGIEPPRFGVVSATVHLPLNWQPVPAEADKQTWRLIRDLTWNPQKFVGDDALAKQKQQLIAAEPQGKAARREWFRNLQNLTAALREPLRPRIEATEEELSAVRQRLAGQKIAFGREYSWVLFPEEILKPIMISVEG